MSARHAADVPWSGATQPLDRTTRARRAPRCSCITVCSLSATSAGTAAARGLADDTAGPRRRRGRCRGRSSRTTTARNETLPAVKSALSSLLSVHTGLTSINRGDLGPMCQGDSSQSSRMVRRPCRRIASQCRPGNHTGRRSRSRAGSRAEAETEAETEAEIEAETGADTGADTGNRQIRPSADQVRSHGHGERSQRQQDSADVHLVELPVELHVAGMLHVHDASRFPIPRRKSSFRDGFARLTRSRAV